LGGGGIDLGETVVRDGIWRRPTILLLGVMRNTESEKDIVSVGVEFQGKV